jgi:hypothetical protein
MTMLPTTAPITKPDGSVEQCASNVINIADAFERGYASYNAAKIAKQLAWKADIVILQFGENIPPATFNAAVFTNSLKRLLADLKASSNPHIFMPSYILGANAAIDEIKRKCCAEDPTHRVFVDLSSVSKDPANMGAYGHPGDKGMALIAEVLFKAILTHSTAAAAIELSENALRFADNRRTGLGFGLSKGVVLVLLGNLGRIGQPEIRHVWPRIMGQSFLAAPDTHIPHTAESS